MKTTIDIADALLLKAKQVAAQRRSTLRALIEEGLARVLETPADVEPFRLRNATVDGHGAKGWHDLTDDQRTAAMYGDVA
jgi:hypothetical protein